MHKKTQSLYFLIIVVVTLIVFSPALEHSPRALDQIEYLYEIEQFDTLGDILQRSYSYTRNRVFDAGDKIMFRPLLYIFMSFEKYFFGYNFSFKKSLNLILNYVIYLIY